MAIEDLLKEIVVKEAVEKPVETPQSSDIDADVNDILSKLQSRDTELSDTYGMDRIIESLLITKMVLNFIQNGN